jgi:hypothetical protein
MSVKQIKSKHREGEANAINSPDMLRVSIETGQILVDAREKFNIATWEEEQHGNGQTGYSQKRKESRRKV